MMLYCVSCPVLKPHTRQQIAELISVRVWRPACHICNAINNTYICIYYVASLHLCASARAALIPAHMSMTSVRFRRGARRTTRFATGGVLPTLQCSCQVCVCDITLTQQGRHERRPVHNQGRHRRCPAYVAMFMSMSVALPGLCVFAYLQMGMFVC